MRSTIAKPALILPAILAFACVASSANASELSDLTLGVRVAQGDRAMALVTSENLRVRSADHESTLPAGAYTVAIHEAIPPTVYHHVLVKSFLPDEAEAEAAFIADLKRRGIAPRVIVQGRIIEAASGDTIDNRMRLLSADSFPTRAEAEAYKADLAAREQWSWIQSETVDAGEGTVVLRGPDGKAYGPLPLPLPIVLSSPAPLALRDVDTGYWSERRVDQSYAGTIEVTLDPEGSLMLIERLPLETYLQGVLPAEMPSAWPMDALRAQAVAARSEVLVSLAQKHLMDGYDFCGTEHCRAYLGSADSDPRTNEALVDTRGRFLVHGKTIVPTVFSATCGGWTEDNDVVWSGRAQPALRAVADTPKGSARTNDNVARFLRERSRAYCNKDDRYFRWTRTFTRSELTAIVNKRASVGTVRRIEPGERGPGGRLKWVKVIGEDGSRNVYKELAIRQLFGGLPSALFIVESSDRAYVFRGAGRGHGVGLCQNGARGMADAGIGYKKILRHYYSGAKIERYR